MTPAPLDAPGEVTCDYGPVSLGFMENSVWLASFGTAAAGKHWLRVIGSGNSPLPAGGCIEGNGWAADVTTNAPPPQGPVFEKAARELGGTLVSAGWCF